MSAQAMLFARARLAVVLVCACASLSAAGCGQPVEPGRTHHRLYAWDCPKAPGGRAYLVLRYQDTWTDATRSTRVGLIKFRTDPPPVIVRDQYVWGVPVGSDAYVLFDATHNQIRRRTGYVRQLDVGTGAEVEGGTALLAFADKHGVIEVVHRNGRVVIPAEAGYTDVKLAFQPLSGPPVLALARGEQWEFRDGGGAPVPVAPILTTLDFSAAVAP